MSCTPTAKECLLKQRPGILFSIRRLLILSTVRVCVRQETLCMECWFEGAVSHRSHHNNKGKTGRCYTSSQASDKQTPCAAHFPPIRSRRRSYPMSLPSCSLLDTFVLWLHRCRGSAGKREATTSIADEEERGGEAASISITPIKGQGHHEERLLFYYWMGAAGKCTTRDKRPNTMISPP